MKLPVQLQPLVVEKILVIGDLMNYDYYTRYIYEWLINNNIANKIDTLISLLTKVSVYVEHIAFYGLMLVLLYVGYKFLRIRSRTL